MRMHPILRWSLNSSTDVMEFSSNTWTFFLALLVLLLLMLSSYLRLKSLFTHTILNQRSFDLPFLCPLCYCTLQQYWFHHFSHIFLVYIVRNYYLNFAITSLCYYCFLFVITLHYEAQTYVLNPLLGRFFGISTCDEALQVSTEWWCIMAFGRWGIYWCRFRCIKIWVFHDSWCRHIWKSCNVIF